MEKKYVTAGSHLIKGFHDLTGGGEYEILGETINHYSVLNDLGCESWVHSRHFTSPPYSKQEEKQNIFTHPEWVTIKDDSLGSVTKDKDYKVLEYLRDNYKILDDNGIKCSLNKERFYKVTPEDLLPPKKKSVEHIDEGFEDLVYVAPEDDCLIYQHKLSRDQASFVYDTLKIKYASSEDTYLYYDSTKGWWNGACGLLGLNLKLKNFNDIFKRV